MDHPRGAASRASRDRWAAQVAALDADPAPERARQPITVPRIVAAALEIVEREGFDAYTMRRVALALGATPGALYAHVRDKAALDDLMLGELCARVRLPAPDPERWRAQAVDVCRQLRDQYLRYPGISRTTQAAAPRSLDTLRINEGLLAILVAGGATPRSAAWVIDAAFLYVGAYSSVAPRRDLDADGEHVGRAEVVERLRMLPVDRFPITVTHTEDVTSGEGHERFEHTLGLLFGGATP